ncbi:MAG: FtsX-like permease family protein [Patescibacteria group bacterium]
MFYLRYLWAELTRRWGKTLTISLGLAMASAIIIVIISISQGLSTAQSTVLNPLQNVGTDIMVSRSVSMENIQSLDEATRDEMLSDNRITTDFAKLGDPGEAFSYDTFLPGSMLTFAASEAGGIDRSLVADYAGGLVLNVVHQEGTIPKLAAEIETGGQRIGFSREFRLSDRDIKAITDAQQKATKDLEAQGIDPNSAAGQGMIGSAVTLPAQTITGEVEVPKEVIRQEIGAFSTDIKTDNYTLAGVDISKKEIGLILPSQIVEGRYLENSGEVVATSAFAQKKNYSLNGTVKIGDRDYTLVGIVDPKLYTMTADMYVSLADAQQLAGRDGKVNVLLVKATGADNVAAAGENVAALFTGAKVTDASDTAKEVTGSLVNAANLTSKFIGVTSIIVIGAAFIIVSLLTVLSVNKRVREIGTLKAIGWSNTRVVRQIIGENIVLGIIGAALGVGLAIGGIVLLNHFNISLSATVASAEANTPFGMARRFLGGGEAATAGTTTTVPLHISYSYLVIILGSAVALLGSIFAGALAAFKSSKMKPSEALRNLE